VGGTCVSVGYGFKRQFTFLILRSLHDVHEMNTSRADHVCLSVRMIQLENRWTDLDEIWYGRNHHHLLVL
jgi:hypothetical protein